MLDECGFLSGRAIRNINDWAAIILLDGRYQQPGKKAQLPQWLGSNVQSMSSFGTFAKGLVGFMKDRRGEAKSGEARARVT